MKELAADEIPVTVTCRVLKLSRQPYYRWLNNAVTVADRIEAQRANALFDAHRDDPEFGYRFLADEAEAAGEPMSGRTAWRICSVNRWWSSFGKKHGRHGKKPGPPVHEDLVERDFTAGVPDQLWLTDITEHWTDEDKLYLCAIKDACSGRIVGYSIDSRMQSRLAVNAPEQRGRSSSRRRRGLYRPLGQRITIPITEVRVRVEPTRTGRVHGQSRCSWRQRGDGIILRPPATQCPRPSTLGHPRATADSNCHLDRTDLPPPTPASPSRPIDTH